MPFVAAPAAWALAFLLLAFPFLDGAMARCAPWQPAFLLAGPLLALALLLVAVRLARPPAARPARGAALACVAGAWAAAFATGAANRVVSDDPSPVAALPVTALVLLALWCAAALLAPGGRTRLGALRAGLALRPPAEPRLRRRYLAGAALALPVLAASAWQASPESPWSVLRANALGLVSFEPRGLVRVGRRGASEVDTYRNNALGWRDREIRTQVAPGTQRVLVVGDSFVWGLWIPEQEQTLPSQLRAELERRRPGRWDVVGAGYPGNGLYGYRRAIETLSPAVRPAVVVVSHLVQQDDDPLDAQRLLDLTPRWPPLARLATNLGVRQQAHRSARQALDLGWAGTRERCARFGAGAWQRIAAAAAATGARLVVVEHGEGASSLEAAALPGVTRVTLPPAMRYRNVDDEWWYSGDAHPRPALNAYLARLLADGIEGP